MLSAGMGGEGREDEVWILLYYNVYIYFFIARLHF